MNCKRIFTSILPVGVKALSFLLLLSVSTVTAQDYGVIQEVESALVRVNIITETSGINNEVEINGRRLPNYRPAIIHVFSSTGIVLADEEHILIFLGYRWVYVQGHNARIEITTSQKQKYKGKLVGIDQATGAAVIQLLDSKLGETPICSDCEIRNGATIVVPVIGEPGSSKFGEAQVLSVGSGPGIQKSESWMLRINRPYVEVGYPILNADRQVLGFVAGWDPMAMQTVVYPIAQLVASADKIIKTGEDIRTGWLGVFLKDPRSTPNPGAVINQVLEDSPAQKAGLAAEDILLKYDGQEVQDASHFIRLVQNTPVGSKVELEISRKGEPITIAALIEARKPQEMPERIAFRWPGRAGQPPAPMTPEALPQTAGPTVGLEVAAVTPQLADFLQIPEQTGLLVINVYQGMPGDLAGVLVGDVIVSVDGQSVTDAQSFSSYLQARGWGAQLVLKLLRKGIERSVAVQLPNSASDLPR